MFSNKSSRNLPHTSNTPYSCVLLISLRIAYNLGDILKYSSLYVLIKLSISNNFGPSIVSISPRFGRKDNGIISGKVYEKGNKVNKGNVPPPDFLFIVSPPNSTISSFGVYVVFNLPVDVNAIFGGVGGGSGGIGGSSGSGLGTSTNGANTVGVFIGDLRTTSFPHEWIF